MLANFTGETQPVEGIDDLDDWADAEIVIGNVDDGRRPASTGCVRGRPSSDGAAPGDQRAEWDDPLMDLPDHGRPVADVIADLQAKRGDDVRWDEGRAFSLVYDGGPSVHDVAEQAALMYLHENALNTARSRRWARSSPRSCAGRPVCCTARPPPSGFLTSGGTESIQCAVLAARERGRIERGVTAPEIVLAESAHAAFHKSAHMFGMDVRTTPVRDDWTADVDAMAAAVGPNTVLVVGSAPQYPQGVVDPIPEIAALAATVDANCHVDACMGGFVLPFAELLGRDVPPWDFRVDGVHSISADVHKLGYAPKGVSVIVHRTKQLRRYQTFVFDGWLGGLYASPNLQGTRSGAADGGGVGRDAAPRRRRLRRADPRRAGRRPTGCGPASPPIDGLRVLGDGGSTSWRSPPIPHRRHRSTCSRSATRCTARGWLPRPPGPARLAALHGQPGQRGHHGRLPLRPRRGRRDGRQHPRPLDPLRHAGVAHPSVARIRVPRAGVSRTRHSDGSKHSDGCDR